MVTLDPDDIDAPRLALWTVADVSAILWGLSATDLFDVVEFLGPNSEIVLVVVGLAGLLSLMMTWTDLEV